MVPDEDEMKSSQVKPCIRNERDSLYLASDLVGSLPLRSERFQVSEQREVDNGEADVSHDGGQATAVQAGETFRREKQTKGLVHRCY